MATKLWKKNKILGGGSYGIVHLASTIDSATSLAAVKSAYIYDASSLQKESQLLSELRGHPNIIRCYGDDFSFENGNQVYNLLLEYASGGSLHDLIQRNKGTIPESHVACYTLMLLRGLSAIHEEGIVHCDFKPGNILVFPESSTGTGHRDIINNRLKIADFGLSKKAKEAELHEYNHRCTTVYASPESVSRGLYETAHDIWSLGCVVVEMITGKPLWLFEEDSEEDDILYQQPYIPKSISEQGQDFLGRCLQRNFQQRWTAEDLMNHPFITKNLQELYGSNHLPSSHDCQMNPFGPCQWISTCDLFSTSSLEESQDSSCSAPCINPAVKENHHQVVLLPLAAGH